MGALLLAGGAKGKRYALPNAEILIHQPSGGVQGQQTDIGIHAENILKTRQRLNKIIAFHTGQSIEKVQDDTERDKYLTPEEAIEYGIIDEIITSRRGLSEPTKK
jgi:ATP-dependent Clp protease protease subunit